jgi:hypothetical protein
MTERKQQRRLCNVGLCTLNNSNGMGTSLSIALLVLCAGLSLAQNKSVTTKDTWRSVSDRELEALIPARAQVQKERIETEMRTASAIIDDNRRVIAGVVLISAGYSAEGNYSHYFVSQVPIQVGRLDLPAGEYVFGYRRGNDNLEVTFYDAASGKEIGKTKARRGSHTGKIASFRISPPSEKSTIELGRFVMPYRIKD